MNRRYSYGGLLILLVLAACTTDPAEPSPTMSVATTTVTQAPTTTTTSTLPAAEATEAFRDCLARAGVVIEPVPFDAQGRMRLDLVMREVDFADSDAVEALGRCSEHLSQGALDSSASPQLQEAILARLNGFSECVRGRGVPGFPDPVPAYDGIGDPYPSGEIPYDDPDLAAAVRVCADRLLRVSSS